MAIRSVTAEPRRPRDDIATRPRPHCPEHLASFLAMSWQLGGGSTQVGTDSQPTRTVGKPMAMVPPWRVGSPILAAGRPSKSTSGAPMAIASGGPTQMARSPIHAAGRPPIRIVGAPGPTIGPPTCGIGGTQGVCMGQTCMSVSRAAGCGMMEAEYWKLKI